MGRAIAPPKPNLDMEKKYFVIRIAYGIMSIQKSFTDRAKAMMFAELLADGKENDGIKYYVTETIEVK